jgi:prolyl-tRNA synthetase
MRMTRLFSQTLRESPAEAEMAGHQLLLRAGFIRQLGAGIFSYLPLARRSLTKIENIMRQEIDAIGGQEITMPVVHPAELWKRTNRWFEIGPEMGRFLDRSHREMVLAMTHEEVVADLAGREIKSYRQLPLLLYHIQTKWRDDPRPRAGLIRAREFTMLDSYSLDVDEAGLAAQYDAHYAAYFRIFGRCGLPVIAVEGDVGMMGGSLAHEYMYLNPGGEDTLLICDACGHTANRQVARFRKTAAPAETLGDLKPVATPDATTIAALAQMLGMPASKTAKAVFLIATISGSNGPSDRFVFAVVRGDMQINETKLANVIGAQELRPATQAEIRATGAIPGYASPVGLEGTLVVVDEAIPSSPNLVAGANRDGFHYMNVNFDRDFKADIVADITAAQDGDACPRCGAPLHVSRGVEVGNIFKLGTHFSQALEGTFLDRDGSTRPIVMGSYGIGSGRLLACIAEEHHDSAGLDWPVTVAPYHMSLISLSGAEAQAETLYAGLVDAGIEVLFDDRQESAGVKFNDADLIGLPLRMTVSPRSLRQGGAELKPRHGGEPQVLPLEGAASEVRQGLRTLEGEIEAQCASVAPLETRSRT